MPPPLLEKNNFSARSGLALLSNVLIIAMITILLGGALMVLSFYSLKTSSGYLQKVQSLVLNNSCAEEALYLIRSQNFVGNNQLAVDGQTCNFVVKNPGGENRRIEISNSIGFVFTKTLVLLRINASSTITIDSWKEVADF